MKAQRRIQKPDPHLPSHSWSCCLRTPVKTKMFKEATPCLFCFLLFEVRFQYTVILVLVFQRMDTPVHWINHYPMDKYYKKLLRYPVDSYLSNRYYITIEINHSSLDKYYNPRVSIYPMHKETVMQSLKTWCPIIFWCSWWWLEWLEQVEPLYKEC